MEGTLRSSEKDGKPTGRRGTNVRGREARFIFEHQINATESEAIKRLEERDY